MNIEEIREFCLSLPGTTESFPFDDTTLVFKVMGKMYCLMSLDGDPRVSLKNVPDKIVEMREQYDCVIEAYHMNKVHWNMVMIDHPLPDAKLIEWITDSYHLVISGLTRKLKEELKNMQS
jgi:predicted DNA-binding protein (MmcQ/YjbR family)